MKDSEIWEAIRELDDCYKFIEEHSVEKPAFRGLIAFLPVVKRKLLSALSEDIKYEDKKE